MPVPSSNMKNYHYIYAKLGHRIQSLHKNENSGKMIILLERKHTIKLSIAFLSSKTNQDFVE